MFVSRVQTDDNDQLQMPIWLTGDKGEGGRCSGSTTTGELVYLGLIAWLR